MAVKKQEGGARGDASRPMTPPGALIVVRQPCEWAAEGEA
jgi:hypothetical protein